MSVTSYLSENEAENLQNGEMHVKKPLQNGYVHVAQIPDFEMNISRTILRIEVGDGSNFCIFHALSFELNSLFDQRFPLMSLHVIFCDLLFEKLLH